MSNCCIVILSSLIDGTGNKSTAQRICSHLRSSSYKVLLCDINQFQDAQSLQEFVQKHTIHAVIGIHLLKAGVLIVDLNIPYIIIAGGTDLNVSTKDASAVNLMTTVAEKAKYLVVFNDSARNIALDIWPYLSAKFIVQPQCVFTTPDNYSFADLFYLNESIEINWSDSRVFLVVGGIRRVKDPLFVAEAVSQMHSLDSTIHLVIIGPELDPEFSAQCREKVNNMKGVHMFPAQSQSHIHSLMQKSFALVNSSHSEGMSEAILEALSLGTAVIARRNEGNLSVIEDGKTGLVYSTSEEFREKCSLLLSDEAFRLTLVENGKHYIEEYHNADRERELYVSLVKRLMSSSHE